MSPTRAGDKRAATAARTCAHGQVHNVWVFAMINGKPRIFANGSNPDAVSPDPFSSAGGSLRAGDQGDATTSQS